MMPLLMKNFLIHFIALTFFLSSAPSLLAAEPEYLTLFYSNDLRGEIEPCG